MSTGLDAMLRTTPSRSTRIAFVFVVPWSMARIIWSADMMLPPVEFVGRRATESVGYGAADDGTTSPAMHAVQGRCIFIQARKDMHRAGLYSSSWTSVNVTCSHSGPLIALDSNVVPAYLPLRVHTAAALNIYAASAEVKGGVRRRRPFALSSDTPVEHSGDKWRDT